MNMKTVFTIVVFLSILNLSATTIGVANGNATSDGRPLMWKKPRHEQQPGNPVLW